MKAIEEIRRVADRNCFPERNVGGGHGYKESVGKGSAGLCALLFCFPCLVLSPDHGFLSDSFLFLLSIGMAILYNLGTNVFLGQISYITKALSAVLQLGVTMDYSIFLWHSYQEQQQTGYG